MNFTKNTSTVFRFILYFLFVSTFAFSQDSLTVEEQAEEESPGYYQPREELNKKQWSEITKGIKYDEKEEEEKNEEKEERFRNFSIPHLSGDLAKLIFYTIVILVLAFVLYKIFSSSHLPASTTLLKTEFNIEIIDENLMEVELFPLLEKAIAEKDFRAAIRIYYLLTIQELSKKKWIKWEKDKTNGEYIAELNATSYFSDFRKNTIAYERVWFGNAEWNENKYNLISPGFKLFVEKLKEKEANGEKQ